MERLNNQPNPQTGEIQQRPSLASLTKEGLELAVLIESSIDSDRDWLNTNLETYLGQWLTKVEHIGSLLLSWRDEIELIDAQITIHETHANRLKAIKRTRENNSYWLEQYTAYCFLANEERYPPTEKKKNPIWRFPLFKMEVADIPISVNVLDETKVPARFKRIPVPKPEVNKMDILAYYKETGEVPEGIEIVTNKKRLVVK